jgi:spore coat protein H
LSLHLSPGRGFLLAAAAALLPLLTASAKDKPRMDDRAGVEVFDPAPVLRIKIELTGAALKSLHDNHRTFVRATVREGADVVYHDVGLHLKGSAGSFRPIDGEKPGFSLKFNKFVRQQKFHGLKKLLLNNAVQDPSYLSEMVGNELFRLAGVPAQRNGFAMVELNGKKMGLYVIAEAVTRDFLRRWFSDPSGNLYEGPSDVSNIEGLDADSRGGKADRSDLRALTEAASEASPSRRLEKLEKVLDVDRFLSFLAMESITAHWDGYAVGVNNYHVYHDPETDRMVFMPHGTDQLFQQPDSPLLLQASGLVARQVLRTATGRRRYRERLESLLEKVYNVAAIERRISELTAKINPVLNEGHAHRAAGQEQAARATAERVAQRARSLRDQLAKQSAPPAGLLAFDDRGVAHPAGWELRKKTGQPAFQRAGGEGEKGGSALKVQLAEEGDSCGSWRVKVGLTAGSYRLSGRVRLKGVKAQASANPRSPSGAGLRVSGKQPGQKRLGDQDWSTFDFTFDVDPEAVDFDPPMAEVELVCELQGSGGEAWFDEASLELTRLTATAAKTEPSR